MPLSKRRLISLRNRLQRCEKRIIEIARWDDNYFYDGFLTDGQRNRLVTLFEKRKNILNEMFLGSDNELSRLNQLNARLLSATKQMDEDMNHFYAARRSMSHMAGYNGDTYIETRLEFGFDGERSVLAMEEDDYYGSAFAKMINVLVVENGFSYSWIASACRKLDFKEQLSDLSLSSCPAHASSASYPLFINQRDAVGIRQNKMQEHGRDIWVCAAFHDLYVNHLFSLPDALRMNHFSIRLNLAQRHCL